MYNTHVFKCYITEENKNNDVESKYRKILIPGWERQLLQVWIKTKDWGSAIWLMEVGRTFERKKNNENKIMKEGILGAWSKVMVYITMKLGGNKV